MRCSVINIALLAIASTTLAAPLSGVAPARREGTLAARQYPYFPGFGNTAYSGFPSSGSGDASTGDADDANGGSVTNNAGPTGTVDNEDASGESCSYFTFLLR